MQWQPTPAVVGELPPDEIIAIVLRDDNYLGSCGLRQEPSDDAWGDPAIPLLPPTSRVIVCDWCDPKNGYFLVCPFDRYDPKVVPPRNKVSIPGFCGWIRGCHLQMRRPGIDIEGYRGYRRWSLVRHEVFYHQTWYVEPREFGIYYSEGEWRTLLRGGAPESLEAVALLQCPQQGAGEADIIFNPYRTHCHYFALSVGKLYNTNTASRESRIGEGPMQDHAQTYAMHHITLGYMPYGNEAALRRQALELKRVLRIWLELRASGAWNDLEREEQLVRTRQAKVWHVPDDETQPRPARRPKHPIERALPPQDPRKPCQKLFGGVTYSHFPFMDLTREQLKIGLENQTLEPLEYLSEEDTEGQLNEMVHLGDRDRNRIALAKERREHLVAQGLAGTTGRLEIARCRHGLSRDVPRSPFAGDSKELRDLLMLLRDALVHCGSYYWETFPDGERVGPVLHDTRTWHVSWGEPEWILCGY